VAYIDAHGHLTPRSPCDATASAAIALSVMDSLNIRQTLILSAPEDTGAGCEDDGHLAAVANAHPDRFAFLGGGVTLNAMTLDTPDPAQVTQAMLDDYGEKALDVLSAGAAGFAEIGIVHLSFKPDQPYFGAPADHPFFLLLLETAGRYRVPSVFHMDVVACEPAPSCTIPLPEGIPPDSNPSELGENLTGFQRLLAHDRDARVVWAHSGWDDIGFRTVSLMRRLLRDHPNLYMDIKLRSGNRPNAPLDASGRLDAGWLALLKEFPDRFVIGVDRKYPKDSQESLDLEPFQLTRALLDQLPPDLARKVGFENAIRIYNLNKRLICHQPGTRAEQSLMVDASGLSAHLGHGDYVGPCRD
jgi:hypothetical protein